MPSEARPYRYSWRQKRMLQNCNKTEHGIDIMLAPSECQWCVLLHKRLLPGGVLWTHRPVRRLRALEAEGRAALADDVQGVRPHFHARLHRVLAPGRGAPRHLPVVLHKAAHRVHLIALHVFLRDHLLHYIDWHLRAGRGCSSVVKYACHRLTCEGWQWEVSILHLW